MRNWYTKASSGGLQQHYPRGGMEQLQTTKPISWIPLKILEKVALQDYPGTEPRCNGPCLMNEKQIMAGSYTFESTRTGQMCGKSSRGNVPCFLASAKPQSPSLGSEALWCCPCRLVWAFSFLLLVSLGKLIWDIPGLNCKPLKNLPHFLANWWALLLKWSRLLWSSDLFQFLLLLSQDSIAVGQCPWVLPWIPTYCNNSRWNIPHRSSTVK